MLTGGSETTKLILTGLFLIRVSSVHIHNPKNDLRGATWGYGAMDGPAIWIQEFPSCNGSFQSPINLSPSSAEHSDPGPVRLVGYDMKLGANLENNGHTVVLSLTSSIKPYIFGGRLPGTDRFEFLQCHWHWGSSSKQGSEHRLEGEALPMELHLVHWNTKYRKVEEAVNKKDGLAVLAFLYKIQEEDNNSLTEIVSHLTNLTDPHHSRSTSSPMSLTLSSLIPDTKGRGSYFYYQGSLTTPTCDESVLWTVFRIPLGVSEQQLAVFRKIHGFEGDTLSNNFRDNQPVGERKVYLRTVQVQHQVSEDAGHVAGGVTAVLVTVSMALLAVLLYVSMVSVGDNPGTRSGEFEELISVMGIDKMINKYGWNK